MLIGVGDSVRTPLGKGVVIEARNNGRLVVDLKGRACVFEQAAVSRIDDDKRKKIVDVSTSATATGQRAAPVEIDLHGLTVAEAVDRAQQALNDALLADAAELRLIHGRSGGRLRGALHTWLRGVPAVRQFRIDPRNAGVTVVTFG